MKKNLILLAVLCCAMVFAGCKSKESAYKKAYEKAKAQEEVTAEEEVVEVPVVTPMVEAPAEETTVVVSSADNESFRTEDLSVVDGDALKNYSVVVGSFSLKANAEGLTDTLRSAGYAARIAYNADRNMYRVVATSFDTRGEAIASRDELRSRYPDAWLLYQQ
ncbi:MAG: SPOR domain-containing protein [Prevotella sp.]|nr:SPOR domain-containing protein [Prevotella sp.]MCD8305094.1 SPOR domain-containing protein [Prevotella sp.]